MSNLVRKKITVRAKGKTFQRSVMVRAGDKVKSGARKVGKFLNKHKGKIAAGVALAGTAYLGHKHHAAISHFAKNVVAAHSEGVSRGVKFNKAAQQAQWSKRKTAEHTVKGYRQGFSKRMARGT